MSLSIALSQISSSTSCKTLYHTERGRERESSQKNQFPLAFILITRQLKPTMQ